MATYKTTIDLGGVPIEITEQSFKAFMRKVASLQDLGRTEYALRQSGVDEVAFRYYKDNEGNEYYGLKDAYGRSNASFGQYRDVPDGEFPFFPKTEVYDGAGQNNPQGGSGGGQPPQAPNGYGGNSGGGGGGPQRQQRAPQQPQNGGYNGNGGGNNGGGGQPQNAGGPPQQPPFMQRSNG